MKTSPIGYLALFISLSAFVPAGEVYHAQGEMAGEVGASQVHLQSRLTALPGPELAPDGDTPGAPGVAAFEWSDSEDFAHASRSAWLTAAPDNDFIVRTTLRDLRPGQRYFYRLIYGSTSDSVRTGPTRSFKTLAPLDAAASVSFCMGNCMHYDAFMSGVPNGDGPATATEEDKRLGFRVFAAMRKLRPDFFIGAGDAVYYDFPRSQPATTLPELRKKWHEQFRLPRLTEFFADCPAFWSKDDHDFRFDDADLEGAELPSATTGEAPFPRAVADHPSRRQGIADLPHGANPSARTTLVFGGPRSPIAKLHARRTGKVHLGHRAKGLARTNPESERHHLETNHQPHPARRSGS